jgi:adenylosuccinate lyase
MGLDASAHGDGMIPRYTLPDMGAIWTDAHRLSVMLEVELLVLEAQSKRGLVPRAAVAAIRRRARIDAARIQRKESKTRHDVIAFIEHLEDRVGRYGRYLHFGLTSSDVLDTSLAVLLRQATGLLQRDVKALRAALAAQALRYKRTITIGRTHGVHAEPTSFGLKLAVFYDEFGRHEARLARALAEVSVGKISGAVGTFANVDPSIERAVCRRLGLSPAPISTQIIQRDIHAAYMGVLAGIGSSLDKLATEIRHLQRTEVREAEEPFGHGQKGSSAMPHKQNPITCERICGLSRLLRGYAVAALENVPLWHERDISHSSVERVILPDATIALDHMLQSMTGVVQGLIVHPDRMRANLERMHGAIYSGQVLLALMRQGLSRTQAYELVQRNALESWRTGTPLSDVLKRDAAVRRHLTPSALARCFDPARHLKHVDTIFRRVGLGGNKPQGTSDKRPALSQVVLVACCLSLVAGGCVRRALTIETDPPGAVVYLNDVVRGVSPATFDFEWYGWHRLMLQKTGYERVEARRVLRAPPYLWIPLDLAVELLPYPVRDRRVWRYTLRPLEEPQAPVAPTEELGMMLPRATEASLDTAKEGE